MARSYSCNRHLRRNHSPEPIYALDYKIWHSRSHYNRSRQFEADLFRQLTRITGTTHIHTTAYHPAANGMVERLHRQIKTAIKCHATEAWTEVLPVIMMGIRAAFKQDLHATPAEMVYGETIRLPGEFLQESKDTANDTYEFITKLKQTMTGLRPQLAKRHGTPTVFEHRDLETSTHVFLRHDAPKRALQPTYDGPYEVLNRGEKVYKLRVNGKTVNVTKDRLKPAYMLADESEPATRKADTHEVPASSTTPATQQLKPTEIKTRSGRTSRKTVRFQIPY